MSDYFDYTSGRLTPGTTARASDVNATLDALSVGLDKLPDEDDLKRGLINFVSAGGTASAITVTLPYAPAALVDGMEIVLKVTATNTGATTINPNSLGETDIRRRDGSVLQEGDLAVGNIASMRYNITSGFFEITGSMTEGVGSMATQNSTAVSITGGAVNNVTMTGGTVGDAITDMTAHIAATAAHGAVSAATVSTIVTRDSSGRAKMVAPSASDDIAIKSTVDDHDVAASPHSGVLEPAFSKNTGFNKNLGTTSGTVAEGNDSRFLPAYGAVGSYVFALIYGVGYGVAIAPEDTFSGWNVRPTGVSTGGDVGETVTSVVQGWSDFSGTWRAHGHCSAGAARYSATLFQRIV